MQVMPIRERVKTIAFPGPGTGVGGVGAHTCARQVQQAIEDVVLQSYTMPGTWAEASERHQLLYTDRVTGGFTWGTRGKMAVRC